MAQFKGPKTFNPTKASAPAPAKKDNLKSELGFGSDESEHSGSGSESESDHEKEQEDDGGISFIAYVTLQKSLKKTTEQKLEYLDQLRVAKDEVKKLEIALNRATNTNRTQLSILSGAQRTQLEEKDKVIESLQMTIDEMDKGGSKAQGMKQMVDTITKLSNDKRTLTEESKTFEMNANQAKADLEQYEAHMKAKEEELMTEIKALRLTYDPVAAEKSTTQQLANVNSEEVETLRNECQKLRQALRDAESAPRQEAGGASSAQVARLESEIKDLHTTNKKLKDELKDVNAQVAKLKANLSSDSEKDKFAQNLSSQQAEEIASLKMKSDELTRELEQMTQKFQDQGASLTRTEGELNDLKTNLANERARMQTQNAAGEESMKSVQTQLQLANQDLVTERASLKGEKAAHATTQAELAATRGRITELEKEMSKKALDHDSLLKDEKERAAHAMQKAKADAAAQLAELKQRALDEKKDIEERLSSFNEKIGPMFQTVKVLSAAYKQLRKEARDLQGEIAPVTKQTKRDLVKMLADIDHQYKEMLRKYRKEMALRKKLHNEIVDLKGSIRVFCRVRPRIKEDGDGETQFVVGFDGEDDQLVNVANKARTNQFELDVVFKPTSTQEDVFREARDLITSVIDGFNVCIFAYGQTGSGKTFTMEGSDAHPGLNRRALSELFKVAAERGSDWSYELEVSVMEIYNEDLRDLLGANIKKPLEIKYGKQGLLIPGLTKHSVRNAEEVRKWFDLAKSHRSSSATKMNEASSRSHCLLVVYITGTNLSTGVQTVGKLNLIDLAGSERVAKSGAIDDEDRMKEATNINKSLSSLGDVIHALGAKQKHIPYRNSTLTYLLQDSLGGSAKTLMVVQVSPVEKNVQETVCSLNFATRVRAVELGQAKQTKDTADVAALKKQLKEMEAGKHA